MSKVFSNIQPAIKAETKKVAIYTLTGVVLIWIVFGVLHLVMPEKVSLDYTVFLGGIGGGLVAVINFLWMGIMVQKAVSVSSEEDARTLIKGSYTQRMLFQMVWVIITIVAPCFHYIAGILPLLIPGTGIKIMGILKK